MDVLTEVLSTVLAGLSLTLMAIALGAASRYHDSRLGLVGVALGLFFLVGVLSLLHQLSPLYGTGLGVDPVPLGIAVVAVALLYAALIHPRTGAVSQAHG
ncbi:MAG TPA: hypothetical protein VN864_04815 [Thermoplasmata archaeon]|nr:hypothetical protein [Thermoplasmata archaeon]